MLEFIVVIGGIMLFIIALLLLLTIAVKLDEASSTPKNEHGAILETTSKVGNVLIRRKQDHNDHKVIIIAKVSLDIIRDIKLALSPAFVVSKDHPLEMARFKKANIEKGPIVSKNFDILEGTWHKCVEVVNKQGQTILYTQSNLTNDQLIGIIELFPGCSWIKYKYLGVHILPLTD